MSAIIAIDAPAGVWTEIDPDDSLGMQISNRSFSVPIRVAVAADEPETSTGFWVLEPDASGATAPQQLTFEDGESVWVRPHDHSGRAGKVAYQLDAVAA